MFDLQCCQVLCNVPAREHDVVQHAGPGTVHTYTYYATFDVDSLCSYIPPETAILLPASSWARKGLHAPRVPAGLQKKAADSGGYVASFFNHGQYAYSLDQYVGWCRTWLPLWAATMDLCCEHELGVLTEERQQQTTENAWAAWNTYRSESWAWVPTIQGRLPEDYRRHAYALKPLLDEMRVYYANNPYWRVGIGTLCRRSDVVMVNAILSAVREVLPADSFQLWGLKLDALRSLDLSQVVSSDSAVWHGSMYARDEIARAAAACSMSMREYKIKVNLPAYTAKVYAAVEESYRVIALQQDQTILARARAVLGVQGWTLHLRSRRNRTYAYAARRQGKQVEQTYLCAVSGLAAWLADLECCATSQLVGIPVVQRTGPGRGVAQQLRIEGR